MGSDGKTSGSVGEIMRNRKRNILKYCFTAVLTGCILCLTAGCRQEQKPEQIKITLMHGYGGTLESYAVMQEIYSEFEMKNPDIQLNCIAYTNNQIAVEKANDMLAVGEMPDILSTNGLSYYIDNAVKTNMAMDLMPYIEADNDWKQQIHPSIFEAWKTEEGHLYTIPDALELMGYWYNEDYLKQAGIKTENGKVRMPAAWDEFFVMTEQVQSWMEETGRAGTVFAMEDAQMTEFTFLARLAGEGETGLEAAKNSRAGIQREDLAHTLRDLERIQAYSKPVENVENARQCFMDGESVIYFNGVWEAEVLKNSRYSGSFAYANYPTVSGESLSYVSPPSGYVLARQTDERKAEACIRFLKYMLSEEVQTRIAVETGQVPANPNVDVEAFTDNAPLFGKAVDTVNQADIQIQTIANAWEPDKWNVVKEFLGQKTWKPEKLEEMLEELNRHR